MEKTVNDRIKMLRTQLKLSQSEFATEIGTSMMTVSRWETGSKVPMKNIYRINQVFGVSVEWLETGEGELEITTPVIETKQSGLQKAVEVLESKVEHLEGEIQFYRELLLSNAKKVAANFNPAFGIAGYEIEGKLQTPIIQMFTESVRVAG